MADGFSSTTVFAPAKLNIRLKITGRRADGYHELSSIMVPVDLFDRLDLQQSRKPGIYLACSRTSLPENEENLVFRAAIDFFDRTGIDPAITIRLTKNIPIAAGLGGGSSDAASTIMALNHMWSEPLSAQELEAMALGLGADVPFFLKGCPCTVRGIGEELDPIENWPEFWYVIVAPPLKVSTSWVYRNLKLELTSRRCDPIISDLGRIVPDVASLLENDLESVTMAHFPAVSEIKRFLLETGAEGALMSGSGPSVFGIFRSRKKAVLGRKELISRNLGKTFLVKGITKDDWGVVKW